jgi:uncharacterized SAM-binding protein YcdF (DUF218 family)
MSNASIMSEVAQSLGVRSEDIVLEEESLDTRHEALLLRPALGTNAFVLVTSASHMPRSVGLFRNEGMNPTPAPTDHLVSRRTPAPGSFFPGTEGLLRSERAAYEWMGLTWSRWRGWLKE